MSIGINPTVDFACKRLLGSPEHPAITLHFLNSVLRLPAPIEQWLYFFCRAEESTVEELTARLPDPVFSEATGVLEMIARNPNERRFYNERLKMERDARAKTQQAIEDGRQLGLQEGRQEGRQEGLEEGIQVGERVGRVKLLQSLNGESPSTSEELLGLGADQLIAIERNLQRRLSERSG